MAKLAFCGQTLDISGLNLFNDEIFLFLCKAAEESVEGDCTKNHVNHVSIEDYGFYAEVKVGDGPSKFLDATQDVCALLCKAQEQK